MLLAGNVNHHRASERDGVSRCSEERCTISRHVERMNHLRIQCNASVLNSSPRDVRALNY